MLKPPSNWVAAQAPALAGSMQAHGRPEMCVLSLLGFPHIECMWKGGELAGQNMEYACKLQITLSKEVWNSITTIFHHRQLKLLGNTFMLFTGWQYSRLQSI